MAAAAAAVQPMAAAEGTMSAAEGTMSAAEGTMSAAVVQQRIEIITLDLSRLTAELEVIKGDPAQEANSSSLRAAISRLEEERSRILKESGARVEISRAESVAAAGAAASAGDAAAAARPIEEMDLDQLDHEIYLLTLEGRYIDEFLKPTAKDMLDKLVEPALALAPIERAAALRQLLPLLSTLRVTDEILQSSPKIVELPRWETVWERQILENPNFMREEADAINLQALKDIRKILEEELLGNEGQPGMIASLESAIAMAEEKFVLLKPQLLQQAIPEERLRVAILALPQSEKIENKAEAEHYRLLLARFIDSLRTDIAAALAKFDGKRFQEQANVQARLAAVEEAVQEISASQIEFQSADEKAHYTILLTNIGDKLRASIAAASGEFATIVERNFKTIANRAERLRAVETAVGDVAAIADTDQRALYTAELMNLANILRRAIAQAGEFIDPKFQGLAGGDHLIAVKGELRKLNANHAEYAAMDEDVRAHVLHLLQQRCNKLEDALGMVRTAFAAEMGRVVSVRARRDLVNAKLAAAKEALAAKERGTLVLSQLTLARGAAPTLRAVVAAAASAAGNDAAAPEMAAPTLSPVGQL